MVHASRGHGRGIRTPELVGTGNRFGGFSLFFLGGKKGGGGPPPPGGQIHHVLVREVPGLRGRIKYGIIYLLSCPLPLVYFFEQALEGVRSYR